MDYFTKWIETEAVTSITKYLSTMGCQARFTIVAYPQTNGEAETANKVILHGLQKKLNEAKGK